MATSQHTLMRFGEIQRSWHPARAVFGLARIGSDAMSVKSASPTLGISYLEVPHHVAINQPLVRGCRDQLHG